MTTFRMRRACHRLSVPSCGSSFWAITHRTQLPPRGNSWTRKGCEAVHDTACRTLWLLVLPATHIKCAAWQCQLAGAGTKGQCQLLYVCINCLQSWVHLSQGVLAVQAAVELRAAGLPAHYPEGCASHQQGALVLQAADHRAGCVQHPHDPSGV